MNNWLEVLVVYLGAVFLGLFMKYAIKRLKSSKISKTNKKVKNKSRVKKHLNKKTSKSKKSKTK